MTDRTDNFNRTDTTNAIGTPSDAGSDWVQELGTWGISGNQAYESGSTAQAICSLESSVSNVTIEATLATVSDAGLVSRVQNNINYILAGVTVGTGFRLFKNVAGGFTQLGSTAGTPASGDVVKLVSDSDNLHTIYQNGVSVVSGTDAAGSTNTKHGLRSHTGSSNRFDDFSITEIGAGGGALTGSSAATSGATGTLTGNGALSGTSAATSGATGTIANGSAASGEISGISAATSGATATLTAIGALVASAPAVSSATGRLVDANAVPQDIIGNTALAALWQINSDLRGAWVLNTDLAARKPG